MKVGSCRGSLFNTCRGIWQVPVSSWHPSHPRATLPHPSRDPCYQPWLLYTSEQLNTADIAELTGLQTWVQQGLYIRGFSLEHKGDFASQCSRYFTYVSSFNFPISYKYNNNYCNSKLKEVARLGTKCFIYINMFYPHRNLRGQFDSCSHITNQESEA